MSILNQPITLSLPYTNAQICYTRLEAFPPIKQAFHDTILPIVATTGALKDRISEIEAKRQQILDDYLEAGNSLREVDTALNCCIGDLYVGIFDSISFEIGESDLSLDKKLALMQELRAMLPLILDWNPTKRLELDNLLQGTTADIELGE